MFKSDLHFILNIVKRYIRINYRSMSESKPSIVSFRSALLKVLGPVENNFWAMALWQ